MKIKCNLLEYYAEKYYKAYFKYDFEFIGVPVGKFFLLKILYGYEFMGYYKGDTLIGNFF